jgi:hypothetical protein
MARIPENGVDGVIEADEECLASASLSKSSEPAHRREATSTFNVTTQSTLPSTRIPGDEFVDHETGQRVGGTIRQAEMQSTDGVGIDQRRRLERACSQLDIDLIAASFDDRLEAVLRHLVDQSCDRVSNVTRSEASATSGATTDIDR